MKVLKRNDKGNPIEVELTEEESLLKAWYDWLLKHYSTYRAFDAMWYWQDRGDSSRVGFKNTLRDPDFYSFLMGSPKNTYTSFSTANTFTTITLNLS